MKNLQVCIGSACHVRGSYSIINAFQHLIEEHKLSDEVEVKAVFCLGHCSDGVSVKIDDGDVHSLTELDVRGFFKENLLK